MKSWLEIEKDAREHGQGHLIDHALTLPEEARASYRQQLGELDFAGLRKLFGKAQQSELPLDFSKVAAPKIIRLPANEQDRARDQVAREQGEMALKAGRIGIILVAGGQGTRLGHDAPKGTYAIGPVTTRSLFQIHAEKVLALSRRYEKDIPFLIMTSQENEALTKTYFDQHRFFGLKPEQVTFFVQGMLPALDSGTGKVLLKGPGELALSPNGHGGVVQALHQGGHLDRLTAEGITDCYYFQVDNPLTKVADPVFLGHHLSARAEMSLKVLAKLYATERLGNLVELDGRTRIIEYTELPQSIAEERTATGELKIWAGSPAIHLFSVSFLQRLARGEIEMPYHVARKVVPYMDEAGQVVKPAKSNGLKFEMFVFDALPLAERTVAMETSRFAEFEPLKNATGENSPESVRRVLSENYAQWLEGAGVKVQRDAQGQVVGALEISPLAGMDGEELRGKLFPGVDVAEESLWD